MEVDIVEFQLQYLEGIARVLNINIKGYEGDIGQILSRIEFKTNTIFAQGLFGLISDPPLPVTRARREFNNLIKSSGAAVLKSSSLVSVIKTINKKMSMADHWSQKTHLAETKLIGREKREGIRVGIRGKGRYGK